MTAQHHSAEYEAIARMLRHSLAGSLAAVSQGDGGVL
jgi:hypothetical protein